MVLEKPKGPQKIIYSNLLKQLNLASISFTQLQVYFLMPESLRPSLIWYNQIKNSMSH